VLFQIVLFGIFVGGLAAMPFVLYRRLVLHRLARAGARPAAYLAAALPAIAMLALAIAFVIGWVFGAPQIGRLWLIGVSIVASLLTDWASRPAIWLTGGPRDDRAARDIQLEAQIAAAERSFRRGDVEMWAGELEGTAGTWTPGSVEVHDSIRRALDAHRRREALPLLAERHRELERAIRSHWRPPVRVRRVATAVTLVAFFGVAAPIIGSSAVHLRACIGAEFMSGRLDGPASTAQMPIAEAIVTDPEPGAELAFDEPADLAAAADSRHDSETLGQLESAGFVRGHLRGWLTTDGRTVQADAFEFATNQGALDYQRKVTSHACTYANEAFEGPNGGIGLQVRYSTGDPIVEQVSWVDGTRRYLVGVTHLEPPSTHDRVLRILAAATGSR
jgi:hypothetical protein